MAGMQMKAESGKQPDSHSLGQLAAQTRQRASQPGYEGEIYPAEALEFLLAHPQAMLVDVRTEQEWRSVGVPDAPGAKGKLAAVQWKQGPSYSLNPEFEAQLRAAGATPETPLFFMCRSGGRSLDAALTMTARGYRHCFNVIGGFEGGADGGRSGAPNGWKASQLPCKSYES
jgi:rhodanese-related sulfurtransferase